MPTVIHPLITNAGLTAAQAQSGLGLQLEITHVQLGSSAYVLDPTIGSTDYNRTSLVTPTETVAIAVGHVMEGAFRVDAQFPAWTLAAYGATEIGFWAGDPGAGGVLFAIWAQATPFTQRNNIDYLASFAVGLARVPVGSVTVTFDPDLAAALALVTFHEQAADPHPQYKKHQYKGVREYNANTVLTNADDVGWVIVVSGTRQITLPAASTVRPGETITIIATGGTVTIPRAGADTINIGSSTGNTSLSLTGSDTVELTRNAAGAWVVTGGTPLAPKMTGNIVHVPATVPPPGAVKANGTLLNRVTYAALYAYAVASGNMTASDAVWTGDIANCGKFSPGDGSTTFRVPDIRALTIKSLDDSRGLDAGRTIGSYQADQMISHVHGVNDPSHVHGVTHGGSGNGGDPFAAAGNNADGNFSTTASGTGISIQASAGGAEVRVKSAAMLACIYF